MRAGATARFVERVAPAGIAIAVGRGGVLVGRGWVLFDRRLAGRDSAEPFEVCPLRLFSYCARFFDALLSNEAHFDGNAPCLQRLLDRLHTAPHGV